MARHHPTRRFTHLVAWLLLTLTLSGCNLVPTTTKISPTPTLRPILTPLSTIDLIPSATKPTCQPLGVPSAMPYPGKVGQTWYAEQIVIGTVIAQETRWEGNKDHQFITTYSLFRVEERLRGTPAAEILISQWAGTIDGCTQMNSERLLSRDERLLLFLGFKGRLGPPIYDIMFGTAGVYNFTDNPAGTTSFVSEIPQILSQAPPANLSKGWIVPLDRAPLVPKPTTTPQR